MLVESPAPRRPVNMFSVRRFALETHDGRIVDGPGRRGRTRSRPGRRTFQSGPRATTSAQCRSDACRVKSPILPRVERPTSGRSRPPSRDIATAAYRLDVDEHWRARGAHCHRHGREWARSGSASGKLCALIRDHDARPRRLDLDIHRRRSREGRSSLGRQGGCWCAIRPGTTSHGRDGVTYRLNKLIEKGAAIDDRGKSLSNVADARLAGREWGPSLRSQSARDTMHLIISAKAGTDIAA